MSRVASGAVLGYLLASNMDDEPFAYNQLSTTQRSNFAEAFMHYCSGLPLEDIAEMTGMPLQKLQSRAQYERWPTLKAKLETNTEASLAPPAHPDDIQKRAEMIQLNREKNYVAWEALRDDVMDIIGTLKATKGKNMFKRYFHNKGQIVEHECDMSMSERNALANYMAVVAQGTYAALGDRVSSTGAKDDATSHPSVNGGQSITIILPGVVSKPRAEKKAQVIDLTDVVPTS